MSEQNGNRTRPSGSRPAGTHTSSANGARKASQTRSSQHSQQGERKRTSQGNGGTKRPANGTRPANGGNTNGSRPAGKKTTKKQRKKRKIIIYVVEVVVLLILLVVLFAWMKLNKIHKDDINEEDLTINELDSATQELLSGYTNIALFGLDNRSNGDFDTGRSDSIIVVSINNDTKEVRMVSVYRDTYLDMATSDGSFANANAAYSKGGPTQAISMLNKNLDLDITDYVAADFNAVADCVDLLGGITIEITDEEAAIMNGETGHQDYIAEIEQVTGKKSSHMNGGGTYNLDGVQATAYARIRYTAGDDYRRALRQRTVLTKMIEKAKKADLSTLNKIINSVFGEVSTSFTNAEIISMAAYLQSYELVDTAGFPYYKNTASVGNQGDCVIPCDLSDNVTELHKYLFDDDSYTPSNTVEAISDKISTKTGYTSESAVKTSDPTEQDQAKTDDTGNTEESAEE